MAVKKFIQPVSNAVRRLHQDRKKRRNTHTHQIPTLPPKREINYATIHNSLLAHISAKQNYDDLHKIGNATLSKDEIKGLEVEVLSNFYLYSDMLTNGQAQGKEIIGPQKLLHGNKYINSIIQNNDVQEFGTIGKVLNEYADHTKGELKDFIRYDSNAGIRILLNYNATDYKINITFGEIISNYNKYNNNKLRIDTPSQKAYVVLFLLNKFLNEKDNRGDKEFNAVPTLSVQFELENQKGVKYSCLWVEGKGGKPVVRLQRYDNEPIDAYKKRHEAFSELLKDPVQKEIAISYKPTK